MLDKLPINWGIVSNPLNWLIVVLMLTVAGYVLEIFFQANPNCGCQPRKD